MAIQRAEERAVDGLAKEQHKQDNGEGDADVDVKFTCACGELCKQCRDEQDKCTRCKAKGECEGNEASKVMYSEHGCADVCEHLCMEKEAEDEGSAHMDTMQKPRWARLSMSGKTMPPAKALVTSIPAVRAQW